MLRFHYKKIMGDIADALRTRLGTSNRYKVKDIPQQIMDIPKGMQFDKVVDSIDFMGDGNSSQSTTKPTIIPLTDKEWKYALGVVHDQYTYIQKYSANSNSYAALGFLISNPNTTGTSKFIKHTDKGGTSINTTYTTITGNQFKIVNSNAIFTLPKVKYKILFFN